MPPFNIEFKFTTISRKHFLSKYAKNCHWVNASRSKQLYYIMPTGFPSAIRLSANCSTKILVSQTTKRDCQEQQRTILNIPSDLPGLHLRCHWCGYLVEVLLVQNTFWQPWGACSRTLDSTIQCRKSRHTTRGQGNVSSYVGIPFSRICCNLQKIKSCVTWEMCSFDGFSLLWVLLTWRECRTGSP